MTQSKIASYIKPADPNIFYHNIEPRDPHYLCSYVHHELKYFLNYLYRAIKSMNIERYGLKWEKDESIQYRLIPTPRIKLTKPRNQIELDLHPEKFDPKIPLQNHNWNVLKYSAYEIHDECILILLEENTRIDPNETIRYKGEIIPWKTLSSGFHGRFEYLEDQEGNKYPILSRIERSNFFLLNVKDSIPPGSELYVQDIRVDYEIVPLKTLQGITLYDKEGKLNYIINSSTKFVIESPRKIEGRLSDQSGRQYIYKELKRKEDQTGVWIILHEPEEKYFHADDDQGSIIDLFFQLLYAAMDYEVWEDINVRQHDYQKKIAVYKTKPEENRILLAREPSTEIIYPPKNTYQLRKQREAIQILMYYPTPSHRTLLKLFEPYESATWSTIPNTHTEESVGWRFLTKKREGTDIQKRFVLKALNTPDFAILEGPPGSGKTTAITELIFQLLRSGKRVLLSASTHVAIDNVIEKLIEDLEDEGGLMENGIVPLRIGREKAVSPDIKEYQINRRITKMHEIIEKKSWFLDLTEEEQTQCLNELVIWSSNLVCGTTIGVLQFPHFKQSRRDYIKPEFDYLIIDEASKTIFQEFLVPAVYAKKWILVGDVKQLSPYTETLHVRVNLEGLLKNPAYETAQLVFLKLVFPIAETPDQRKYRRPFPNPKYVYVDEYPVIKALHTLLKDKIGMNEEKPASQHRYEHLRFAFVTLNDLPDPLFKQIENFPLNTLKSPFKFKLLTKDIIFIESRAYTRRWRDMPVSHVLIYPNNPHISDNFEFRHDFWLKIHQFKTYTYRLPGGGWDSDPLNIQEDILASLNKNWAGELAWRMKRVYELQTAKGANESKGTIRYYHASMNALLPTDSQQNYQIWRDIKKIAQISFPSILTSIQEGVTGYYRNEDEKTILSSGFHPSVKNERYEILIYQHRMHPDISALPRSLFYAKKGALNDVEALLHGGERDWTFPGYDGRRLEWIQVGGRHVRVRKNRNKAEAEVIMKELADFLAWVDREIELGNKDDYTVAILTFYEQQRKELRDLIKEKYPEEGNQRRETRFRVGKTRVYCYTVDKVQGREADVVFLSMVQNNRTGFIDSPNRLNVAITRAKYLMVVIGDLEFFLDRKRNRSIELREFARYVTQLR